jgi:hypothetical protein
MKKRLSLSVVGAFIALAFASAQAGAEVLKVPLYRLAPVSSIDLKCINGAYDIAVPVPERWDVRGAHLSFSYVNSTNLLPGRSQLVVRWNGVPVHQVGLNPSRPEGSASVAIPAGAIAPGYNTLSFRVSQHYAEECENPCAPDLWTTLNLSEAAILLDYGLKDVPLKLASIPEFLFDPRVLPQGEVNVITEDLSAETVTAAGVVASGIARGFDYRKTVFSVSTEIRPGVDNVLIGRAQFVKAFLRRAGVDAGDISGAFLRITHLPEGGGRDASRALVIVSGPQHEDVMLAGRTLAGLTLPYPATDSVTLKEFTLPEIKPYAGRLMLAPDAAYDFKSLGFGTHTFEGFNPTTRDLTFRLPPDAFIKQNRYAAVTLNFAYGAGMRSDSVLDIILNGTAVKAIHLAKPSGDFIEGYRLEVPAYLFKPGENTLRFMPVLTPIARECDLLQTATLFLTLFDSSTILFPSMPRFAEMPGIELFMKSGFPFTRPPGGDGNAVYIAGANPDNVAAAFNMLGLISQKTGYPLYGVKVVFDDPGAFDGDLLVIGEEGAIPEALKHGAPIGNAAGSTVAYPAVSGWPGEASFAYSAQTGGLGPETGALMEYESARVKGRTVIMLTANTSKGVLALSRAMLEPTVQAKSSGDTVLVDMSRGDYRVVSQRSGGSYFTGERGRLALLTNYLHLHPYIYYSFVAFAIVFFTFIAYLLLSRGRRRRMANG